MGWKKNGGHGSIGQPFDRTAFHGVPVVTGWFGEGLTETSPLGRGSDHTATALAALLHAQRVVLKDARIIPSTKMGVNLPIPIWLC